MSGEQLRVSEGNARGARLPVDADLLIGRASDNDEGRLGDDPEISRRHAQLTRDQRGALTIEDLGSANGTFVNGERIDGPRTLHLGDVVTVGQTALEVTDSEGGVPEPTRMGAAAPAPPTAAPAPKEALLVTIGADKGRVLDLGDEFVIGRAVSGDGRLGDDPELSRRHARLARDAAGRLTVEDLGSANGTYLNGDRVREPRPLRVGDSLQVGRTTLQVTVAGRESRQAQASAPPAPPEPAARPPQAAPPRERQPAPPPPPEPSAPARQPPPPPPSQPAPPPARERVAEGAPVSDALRLGSVFAGCRVEEIIGRGDMGVVYRAEELALQRQVALKLIRPEHSEESRFRERFRRESKVAASIDHPNVVPILEAGDEDGVLYIRMGLVEGTDLRALIAELGRVDPLRAARIIRQVGDALDAAHARGLVHRDVKPANVLLARGDHVYLSDFGLAKHAADMGGLTQQGSIIARAEYVAPEQIVSDHADALTDVYALGCLLYETLTGEAPFADSKGGGAMLAHVDEPPPSPVERRPDLPHEFDEVVGRAMAKDPSERYTSAGDLGEAALVAAGGLKRAREESVFATGDASFIGAVPAFAAGQGAAEAAPAQDPGAQPAVAAGVGAEAPAEPPQARGETLRWGLALGVLVVLALLMVLALGALSKL